MKTENGKMKEKGTLSKAFFDAWTGKEGFAAAVGANIVVASIAFAAVSAPLLFVAALATEEALRAGVRRQAGQSSYTNKILPLISALSASIRRGAK